jgi:RNA polymerase sigma factor (sigma-70 family)
VAEAVATPALTTAERQALACSCLKMARGIARPFKVARPNDADEFDSAAFLALAEAADRYEPGRGASFKTFARYRINGALLDALKGLDRPVRSMLDADEPSAPRGVEPDPGSAELVEAMLATLRPLQAEAIRLVDLGGCRHDEAAEVLGVTRQWVSKLRMQAFRSLRHAWSHADAG